MVATVSTYLQRILQFPLVEVGFAPVTLDEDILRLHNALFGRDILNSLVLFAKPGHLCFTALEKFATGCSERFRRLAQDGETMKAMPSWFFPHLAQYQTVNQNVDNPL